MYPLDEYRDEIAAMPLDCGEDLIGFIPQAARLAALPGGDAKPFLGWPGLADRLSDSFSTLLRDRVREGLWDLDNALGGNLGIAVVNAQDFRAFAALARELTPEAADRLLPDDVMELLDLWRDEAEDAGLDAEAVSFLTDWAELFPIRQDLRLRIVWEPYSIFEERLMASLTGPLPLKVERYDIGDLSARADGAAAVMAADGERPSQSLMRLAELDKEIRSPQHGVFFITRRLDPDWRLSLVVEREVNGNDEAFPLDSVRFGVWPAKCGDGGEWAIDARRLSRDVLFNMLRAPIWLSPNGGDRICLH